MGSRFDAYATIMTIILLVGQQWVGVLNGGIPGVLLYHFSSRNLSYHLRQG